MAMIPPHIRNKFSDPPQQLTRPVSIRLSEEMITLLKETAEEHGFKRIQGLIRLYIRQGLDRDNDGYTLADDEVFIEKLRANGVSSSIIEKAIIDTHSSFATKGLLEERLNAPVLKTGKGS